jgi:hypothetical protein
VCYKNIDTSKDHLKHCQAVDYPSIPNAPKYQFSKCL